MEFFAEEDTTLRVELLTILADGIKEALALALIGPQPREHQPPSVDPVINRKIAPTTIFDAGARSVTIATMRRCERAGSRIADASSPP